MPIYMDRHDLPETVTAEHLAKIHQADLKLQDDFGCKGVTYWFDGERKTAFCLIDAPNEKAIHDMHHAAHGGIPNRITEVDPVIVESFLGRVVDPEHTANTELNIIDDSAFRTLMYTEFERRSFKKSASMKIETTLKEYSALIGEIFDRFNGRMVRQDKYCFLASFKSVTNAVSSALEIQSKFENVHDKLHTGFKIGISAGIPVADKGSLFEIAVKQAERIGAIAKDKIIVSSEVHELYKSENLNTSFSNNRIFSLNQSNENFLMKLMELMEEIWNKTDLRVDDFSEHLGVSNSQFYRRMLYLTGKSPNLFIKEYRLNRALKLLQKQVGNISEIAFETGFNSPAYFSKCFKETFGILPSNYVDQNV